MAVHLSAVGSHVSPSTKLGRMEKEFEVQVWVTTQISPDVHTEYIRQTVKNPGAYVFNYAFWIHRKGRVLLGP